MSPSIRRTRARRGPCALAVAASLALAGAPAAGSAAAGVDDPEAVIVPELVVTARAPGPALWIVRSGSAEVVLIGLPAGPVPDRFDFDRRRLRARLSGADYLPPPASAISVNAGLAQGLGLAVRMAPGLGWTNGDILKTMPPDLAIRFDAVRRALGEPIGRYATPIPALAALKLQKDFLDRNGLAGDAARQVEADARAAGDRVLAPVRLTAPSLKPEELSLDRPAIADCLAAVLTQAETDPSRFRSAADGWREGRLATALDGPRDPLGYCETRMYSGAFTRRLIAAETDALAGRLAGGRRTVAALSLRALLAPGGVIEQLKARGYMVIGPSAPDAN